MTEDDPTLYVLYFNFHDQVTTSLDAKKAQSSTTVDNVPSAAERHFAKYLHIDASELLNVTAAARQLSIGLSKWGQDLKSYVDTSRANGGQPDPVTLEVYDEKTRTHSNGIDTSQKAALHPKVGKVGANTLMI